MCIRDRDAANKLNFSTRKTMMVAQQLYEGIEIKGRGTVGLVSYIRTDSVRISDEAREAAREYIMESIGQEYYGGTVYTNKKKDVQDAHEAIRPSYADLEPDSIKDSVTKLSLIHISIFIFFPLCSYIYEFMITKHKYFTTNYWKFNI